MWSKLNVGSLQLSVQNFRACKDIKVIPWLSTSACLIEQAQLRSRDAPISLWFDVIAAVVGIPCVKITHVGSNHHIYYKSNLTDYDVPVSNKALTSWHFFTCTIKITAFLRSQKILVRLAFKLLEGSVSPHSPTTVHQKLSITFAIKTRMHNVPMGTHSNWTTLAR